MAGEKFRRRTIDKIKLTKAIGQKYIVG